MFIKAVSELWLWIALRVVPVAAAVLAFCEIDRLGKSQIRLARGAMVARFELDRLADKQEDLEERIQDLELDKEKDRPVVTE